METWESSQEDGNKPTAGPSGLRQSVRSLFKSHASPSRSDSTQNNASSAQRKVFWLRDFLVEDIPQARVWTYGYNADVIGGVFQANNKNSVSQHGRDLKVRLERDIENEVILNGLESFRVQAHGNRTQSYLWLTASGASSSKMYESGSVLEVWRCRNADVGSQAITRSEKCRSRTKLIVFLGTPHRGSAMAGWGEIASNLAQLAFQDSHKKIVQALDVDSEVLNNIHEQFISTVYDHGIPIHSFQEARGMTGMKGLHKKVRNSKLEGRCNVTKYVGDCR